MRSCSTASSQQAAHHVAGGSLNLVTAGVPSGDFIYEVTLGPGPSASLHVSNLGGLQVGYCVVDLDSAAVSCGR